MKEYWKLIDLDNCEYTTHETEEEVEHIIDYLTRDMDEDKEVMCNVIETPFSNYNFQRIIIVDSCKVRRFLYFFDSIEEECDDQVERCERLKEYLKRQVPMSSHVCANCTFRNNCIDDWFGNIKKGKFCDSFDFDDESNQLDYPEKIELVELRKRFDNLVKEDTTRILSLEEELQELQKQCDGLDNRNAELNGKLIRYAGEIDKLKYELSNLRRTNENLKELVKQINDMTHPF